MRRTQIRSSTIGARIQWRSQPLSEREIWALVLQETAPYIARVLRTHGSSQSGGEKQNDGAARAESLSVS